MGLIMPRCKLALSLEPTIASLLGYLPAGSLGCGSAVLVWSRCCEARQLRLALNHRFMESQTRSPDVVQSVRFRLDKNLTISTVFAPFERASMKWVLLVVLPLHPCPEEAWSADQSERCSICHNGLATKGLRHKLRFLLGLHHHVLDQVSNLAVAEPFLNVLRKGGIGGEFATFVT